MGDYKGTCPKCGWLVPRTWQWEHCQKCGHQGWETTVIDLGVPQNQPSAVQPNPHISNLPTIKKTAVGNVEFIEWDMNFKFRRAKIPGGWLVMAGPFNQLLDAVRTAVAPVLAPTPADGMVFIPDPHHEWDGSPLPL